MKKIKLSIKTTKFSIQRKIHWNPLCSTIEEKSFYCYSVNKKVLRSGSNKTVCTLYLPWKNLYIYQPFLYRSRAFKKKSCHSKVIFHVNWEGCVFEYKFIYQGRPILTLNIVHKIHEEFQITYT